MSDVWRDRTLALGGLYQALHSVQQIARGGNAPTDAIAISLGSVFKMNPASAQEVYGDIEGLSPGLRILSQQLDRKRHRTDPELLRYTINVMYIEQRLRKRPEIMAKIGEQIKQIAEETKDFSPTHPQVIARLAETYVHTVGAISPRIQVRGEETHLKQPDNIERIRALLLAAIRSTVFWRHKGGNRFHLLFQSHHLLKRAHYLLRNPSEADAA